MIERRKFLFGAGLILTAPAIVRFSSLMPVRVMPADLLRQKTELLFRFEDASLQTGLRYYDLAAPAKQIFPDPAAWTNPHYWDPLEREFQRRLKLTPLRFRSQS